MNQNQELELFGFYPLLWQFGDYLYRKVRNDQLFSLSKVTQKFLRKYSYDPKLLEYIKPKIQHIKSLFNQNYVFIRPDPCPRSRSRRYLMKGLGGRSSSNSTSVYDLQEDKFYLSPTWRKILLYDHHISQYSKHHHSGKSLSSSKKVSSRDNRTIGVLGFRISKMLQNEPCTREIMENVTGFSRQRICTVLSIYQSVNLISDDQSNDYVYWGHGNGQILSEVKQYINIIILLRKRKRELVQRVLELSKKMNNQIKKKIEQENNNKKTKINSSEIQQLTLAKRKLNNLSKLFKILFYFPRRNLNEKKNNDHENNIEESNNQNDDEENENDSDELESSVNKEKEQKDEGSDEKEDENDQNDEEENENDYKQDDENEEEIKVEKKDEGSDEKEDQDKKEEEDENEYSQDGDDEEDENEEEEEIKVEEVEKKDDDSDDDDDDENFHNGDYYEENANDENDSLDEKKQTNKKNEIKLNIKNITSNQLIKQARKAISSIQESKNELKRLKKESKAHIEFNKLIFKKRSGKKSKYGKKKKKYFFSENSDSTISSLSSSTPSTSELLYNKKIFKKNFLSESKKNKNYMQTKRKFSKNKKKKLYQKKKKKMKSKFKIKHKLKNRKYKKNIQNKPHNNTNINKTQEEKNNGRLIDKWKSKNSQEAEAILAILRLKNKESNHVQPNDLTIDNEKHEIGTSSNRSKVYLF
ncbi:hypothetical protein M0812_14587 [Anaeramoeba flamelloides]|uniref:Uncharacterized protein n=1 Tax=Anaeramoeba flamelloides TaxID=1746091 RepID=A0AAV7ZFN4_9EUKA|nr:hypothetical protein M0812_14587 [Anaeramoeba flamelloides]